MKSILISIKPEWVAKILHGEKTIEIRKTAPKCELPVSVYIYCTKNKLHYSVGALMFNKDDCFKRSVDGTYKYGDSVELMGYSPDYPYDKNNFLNGKVVAKFTLSKIERVVSCIAKDWGDDPWEMRYSLRLEESDTAHNDDRLMDEGGFEYLSDICDYLGFDFPISNSGFGERPDFEEGVVYGYAWHISDLEIFDEPKELSEFYSSRLDKDVTKLLDNSIQLSNGKWVKRLDKAPQSWLYLEEGK